MSGHARPLCLALCSLQVGGCGVWRTQLGSHSVVEGGTGLVGRVGPWLQGELGPLGYPAWIDRDRDRTEGRKKINRLIRFAILVIHL